MSPALPFVLPLALIAALLGAASPALPDPIPVPGPVGARLMTATGREPGRVLPTVVTYPAGPGGTTMRLGDNPVFIGATVQRDAPPAPGRHPVVLLSHGSGGNAAGLAWLTARLAAAGYVVIGPNHPGTTSGDSSEKATVELWRRPPDLAAALDAVLADPQLGPTLDPTRVAALGFSLGGYDVLALAGARQDRKAFAQYCYRNATMQGCDWLRRGGVDFSALDPRVDGDLREPRIHAVIGIDPAFPASFTESSLKSVAIPVRILNLGTPASTPGIVEGRFIADTIPGARLERIADAVHFSFLGLCKPGAAAMLADEGDDPVCDDPAGSRPRTELHEDGITRILRFLEEAIPAAVAR